MSKQELTFHEKVSTIQATLKASKGQFNAFGKYKYRSCEDILESVKPLLDGLILTINDDIVLVGDRYYIKATAQISDSKNLIEKTAFAREPEMRKGMDVAQVTGASSSYARKYALNGLFCIDDNKDPDTQDNRQSNQLGNVARALTEETNQIIESKIPNEGRDPKSDKYVIPVGKLKGKRICDIDNKILTGYYDWIESQGKIEGPMLIVKEALSNYLGARE